MELEAPGMGETEVRQGKCATQALQREGGHWKDTHRNGK